MAGTVPTITHNNITGMTWLEKRPVYFLKLNGSPDPTLVVKGEGDGITPLADHAPKSIKWGSKLMKNVNNRQVNTKLMTPEEVRWFKVMGQLMVPQTAVGPLRNLQIPGPVYTWTKMPFVPGLTTAEFWNDDNSPDTLQAKKNVPKMSDDTFWTDLGKVVAVDIFNGNCDRFDITSGFWQNKGNIMFLANGPTRVIGLDTFDPNAREFHNLSTAIDFTDLNTRRRFQHLLYLTDAGERLKFARECLASVGKELKRALKKGNVGSFTIPTHGPDGAGVLQVQVEQMATLFEVYVPAFAQGIADGANLLKLHLQNKVRQYAAQQPQQLVQLQQPVQPQQRPRVPMLAGYRGLPRPQPVPVQVQPARVKTIPQGILDRMRFLGW